MFDWEDFVLKCACVLGLFLAVLIYVLMGARTRISSKDSKNCQQSNPRKCEIKREIECKR
jgi:hypothetical protein